MVDIIGFLQTDEMLVDDVSSEVSRKILTSLLQYD
jgi:hypothetical protein